ncbi:MAG TPA: hypothetical protein VHY48_01760 [Acidobacteriaceae bacterium]|jgi:hypothetical protein|nr:hypothetical protein [Acidobacteriaceae bacterium]
MFRPRILGPFLSLSVAVMPLSAQMHHVDQPRQVTRAVGVYEWTGDLAKPGAERLIPVSLFIHGHYEDAGVFLAQPVPFALETGNVYALQKSGDPIGTLDLDYARNIVDRRDVADDNPIGAWYGYGRFLPLSATPAPPLHPSSHLSVIASSGDDDQPHFINRSPGEAGNPGSSTSPTTGSTNTPAPPADPDRPVLHRAPNSSSPANSSSPDAASTDNAPSSPGTADTENDPDRPTLGHRDDNETDKKQEKEEEKRRKRAADGGAVIPLSTSLNDDPNRPTLHHGKVESAVAPPPLTGFPANLHQTVAVSDAATPPQHIFARDWDSLAERADTLAAMQRLAQPLAQQYLATNHLRPEPASTGPKLITPSTKRSSATHRTTHRAAAPKTTPLVFQEEQLAGFTLSYGGLPTFVYTATLPTLPASAPVSPATTPTHATAHHLTTVPAGVMTTDAAATQPLTGPLVRVTVIAQRLPAGNLQLSLTSATDDAHLDRTPWMRLIDAVDADGSHRASLLFELRARSSRQFALYSLTSAHAQQTFITGILE